MTNRAATFVGEIDLICYVFDYYVSGKVYVVYCGSVILVCEYLRSVLDVLMKC